MSDSPLCQIALARADSTNHEDHCQTAGFTPAGSEHPERWHQDNPRRRRWIAFMGFS